MKLLKHLMIGISILALVGSFAVVSSASWGNKKMMNAGTVKTLRDSATALQKVNPELSKELTTLADEHEKMMMKKKAWQEKQIMTIKESAAALQTSGPDLANGLNAYADRAMKVAEGGDMTEMEKNYAADMKLFRDSAAALQTINPELSNKLTMRANKKEIKAKWMEEEAKADVEEKAGAVAAQEDMAAY